MSARSRGRKAIRVHAGMASRGTGRPLHTGIGSLARARPSPSQSGRLRANGSSAGPASPAPRLRTSLPGHGRCRYRVLKLIACCRS